MLPAVASAPWTIPGPPPVPVVGRAVALVRYLRDPIGVTTHLFRYYGPVVSLVAGGGTNLFSPFGSPGTIFVYGPALLEHTRTPHAHWNLPPLTGRLYPVGVVPPRKHPLKQFMARPWGVDGAAHRAERKLVLPAFHHQHLATYRDAMITTTHAVLAHWRSGAVIELVAQMRAITAQIVMQTVFGAGDGDVAPSQHAGQILQAAIAAFDTPLTHLAPYDLPRLPYRRFLDLTTRFSEEMCALIARTRAAPHRTGDVLTMLLQAQDANSGERLADDAVIAWVGSLFAAGHETSSLALSWTLFLLAQHPHIAADLVDELHGTLQGDAPSTEHLQATRRHLPLLDAVVKESLRLIPPAPLSWRIAAQATELGGYQVPLGTEVYGSVYHTHHMPELYADPERFNPRRWDTLTPSVWEYLPFSAGPRRCIGAEFALMEIKLVLALVLQHYRLESVPSVPIDRAGVVTIAPKHGLIMRVQGQDRRFTHGVGGIRGTVREMVRLPR